MPIRGYGGSRRGEKRERKEREKRERKEKIEREEREERKRKETEERERAEREKEEKAKAQRDKEKMANPLTHPEQLQKRRLTNVNRPGTNERRRGIPLPTPHCRPNRRTLKPPPLRTGQHDDDVVGPGADQGHGAKTTKTSLGRRRRLAAQQNKGKDATTDGASGGAK